MGDDQLAFLDAPNDRIVVMRRDGAFDRQYRHADFANASAFVIRDGQAGCSAVEVAPGHALALRVQPAARAPLEPPLLPCSFADEPRAMHTELAVTQTSMNEMTDLGASAVPALRRPSRHRLVRWFFIGLGSLLVAVGVLGIFLPLLPSTVFFLMAAGCYGKSSPGAYRWLTTNRWFGKELREYREEKGATVRSKVLSITMLWIGIGLSGYLIGNPWIQLPLVVVALGVSAHLLTLNTIRR